MAPSTKSPTPTLQQDRESNSTNPMRATVTGVDSGGQLFRDGASVVFLKAKKCIYHSKFKPAPDGSVMIELQSGKEAWRSNAKIQGVSPIGPRRDTFRVTVELDRAHSAVIETSDTEETLSDAKAVEPEDGLPSFVVSPPVVTTPARSSNTVPVTLETKNPDPGPAPLDVPSPPATQKDNGPLSAGGASADSPIKPVPAPMPTPPPKMMVAEIVRSVLASELGQLKRELQGALANQGEAALRDALEKLETKFEQNLRKRPAITEESVRQVAAQAAENAQIEWASTKLQKMVAEAVRSALASDIEPRRRDLAALVSGEIETAIRGPVAARIDANVEKAFETRMEEQSRRHPSVTEETVRQLAAQVAEDTQLEWASTKLQKIVAEAVRSALASDIEPRHREMAALVSGEIEAAVRGLVAARMDATLEKALETKIGQHFQTQPAIAELQNMIAEAMRQPLEAEYEQRGRQIQAMVSGQIEAAVRGPVATQTDEMLTKALEAQRAEYLHTPPPITEETMRQIVANVAEHPQFQRSIDALAVDLSARWTEVARGATTTAQEDVRSRIAATERLATQVVTDIQEKLKSFSTEMDHIFGGQEPSAILSAPSRPQEEELQNREKRFREVLQKAGSQFERDMKTALQKIFGKS